MKFRIIEVFYPSLCQVGNEVLPTSDSGIQQHVELSAGKLLVKSLTRCSIILAVSLICSSRILGMGGNVMIMGENLTAPQAPRQPRDQTSLECRTLLFHQSILGIKSVDRDVHSRLDIFTHGPKTRLI